jgi:hypothetical protein
LDSHATPAPILPEPNDELDQIVPHQRATRAS